MRLGVRDGVILIMNYQLAYTQQHQQQRRRRRKSVGAWATWPRARTRRAASWLRNTTPGEQK